MRSEQLRALTLRFAAMASHYLVEPCFCRLGEGRDKGGIEERMSGPPAGAGADSACADAARDQSAAGARFAGRITDSCRETCSAPSPARRACQHRDNALGDRDGRGSD